MLIILSRLIPKKFEKKNIFPYVTVLLTVHNEEQLIEKRIKNLLEVDYPGNLLEILVASDGSTDKTDHIVELMSKDDGRIKLFQTSGGGKSATQNKAIPVSKGEIVILTDAETIFQKDTIKNIIKNFADNRVGCVSGRLILLGEKENETIDKSQGFYWKYEILLRRLESQIGILHTASGQLMAFRKSLFKPFECKYGDDCIIPLDILLQGYTVVHENEAIAFDMFPSTIKGELKARIRMTLRNFTCTLSKYALLNPVKFPLVSLSIVSHKIFRWLTPYFMFSLFIQNVLLIEQQPFTLILYCQLIFYSLGFIGFIAVMNNYRIPIASQAFSFILANIGFFAGVLKAILGHKITFYKNR